MSTFSRFVPLAGVFCISLFVVSVSVSVSVPVSAVEPLPNKAPVPKDNPMSEAKIKLGRQLYFDPRLSKDGTVSCNSCHNVMNGGTDNRAVSVGVAGKKGGRSAPTVFNAAFLSAQFWDGRAKSLEEQAKGPLLNPVEMAMPDHDAVMARVKRIPGYVSQFKAVFGGGDESVNIDNLAKAIAAYERTLITPNSPFDEYLRGKKKAISASAERGWKKVQEVGCLSCHSGANFAGPALPDGQPFLMRFPTVPGTEYEDKYELAEDAGRMEVTKNSADRHMWRVATWRNVALTAPYFHNGKVQTLDEAVRVMAKAQLGKDLKPEEVTDVVAFLKSLTGRIPPQEAPMLPPTEGEVVHEAL